MHRLTTGTTSDAVWIAACCVAIITRLLMTADSGVMMMYAAHDDGLYVLRAYHLLTDGSLGSYDARTLVKLPGFSFFLAANRIIGVPYLLSIFVLYLLAGLYLVLALSRTGANRWILLGSLVLYLFNPVTLDTTWYRVLREPLSAVMLVTMLAAMTFILQVQREGGRGLLHVGVLSGTSSLAVLLREDDVLLYILIASFAAIVARRAWQRREPYHWSRAYPIVLAIVLPFASAKIVDAATRQYVEDHYGLPILHDFGEGEFPRMIAAMRSVNSERDNRHVMISQEALQKMRSAVPQLKPVIDRLPRPGPGTYPCERFRVCTEWTNGYMPFWIKDAAFQAGLTPNLPAAQEYFRQMRKAIVDACAKGSLQCKSRGDGLLPSFELRWTRAFLEELTAAVAMFAFPPVMFPVDLPQLAQVDRDTARLVTGVTLTPYVPRIQAGRSSDTLSTAPVENFRSPLASLGQPILATIQAVVPLLLVGAVTAFAARMRECIEDGRAVLFLVFGIFGIYCAFRFLALAYVSVYMGTLEPRMYFASYSALLLLLPAVIAASLRRRVRSPHTTENPNALSA